MKFQFRLAGALVAATIALSACTKQGTAEPEAKVEATTGPVVVDMSAESQKMVGLETAKVAFRDVETSATTTGEVAINPDSEAHVTTRVAGRVLKIDHTIGDWVNAGERLAALESIELGRAEADYLQAEAKRQLAQTHYDRKKKLFAERLTAEKEVQAAETELRVARIDQERVANQLELLGFSKARVAALARTRQVDPTVPLLAPTSGVVTERHLTIGEMLDPNTGDPAFVLADTSKVWVLADLYEKDIARVHEGQPAVITTASFPGKRYEGEVSSISAELEKASRTAKAKIVVANPDHKLKPGMFANVSFDLGKKSLLVVPADAVQDENNQKLVYVPMGEGKFREVPIEVGERYGGYLQITTGLKDGDRVVTQGSFDLHSQARKATFEGEE